MTNEEIIEKLKLAKLPSIIDESHRSKLKSVLLEEYSRVETRNVQRGLFGQVLSKLTTWKVAAITSITCTIITLIVILLALLPVNPPPSVAAKAIDAVLSNEEVRAILTNDEMSTITVRNIGNNLLEVMVESRGGSIIIALVDMNDDTLIIKEITNIIFLGSLYDLQEEISGEEREKALNIASTDHSFQELIDRGATIDKITAIYCIVSTRHLDSGETVETKERWAFLKLEFENKYYGFEVDMERGRVLSCQ
jgi:hypothetical protein